MKFKFLSLALLLLIAACVPSMPESEQVIDLWVLDVGYGDAILIRSPETNVWIDGGYPVCADRVIRTLQALGIDEIDLAVLTHPHPDHAGGFFAVLASGIPVREVVSPFDVDHPEMPRGIRDILKSGNPPCRIVRRGDRIQAGPMEFSVFSPERISSDLNASCAVLRLDNFGGGVLLCADIGSDVQAELVTRYGMNLHSSILKAPHHGGALDPEFFALVDPDIVCISVGVNPYGNPEQATLDEIERSRAKLKMTSRNGTIRIRISSEGVYQSVTSITE
jgi:competence protein ComEC